MSRQDEIRSGVEALALTIALILAIAMAFAFATHSSYPAGLTIAACVVVLLAIHVLDPLFKADIERVRKQRDDRSKRQ